MREFSLNLYLEINSSHFVFFVGKNDSQNNFEVTYELEVPLVGITNGRISDLESFFDKLKKIFIPLNKNLIVLLRK